MVEIKAVIAIASFSSSFMIYDAMLTVLMLMIAVPFSLSLSVEISSGGTGLLRLSLGYFRHASFSFGPNIFIKISIKGHTSLLCWREKVVYNST